jgi:hypothetical protein
MTDAGAIAPERLDADAMPGERYALHPEIGRLWRIRTAIGAALLVLPGAIPTAIFLGWYGPLLNLFVAAAVIVLAGRYSRAYIATFRCVLLPDGLLIKRGVVWQKETFVPRPRIQHTDVDQGPIARRFGIATLRVFTAGTNAGELEIDGLAREDSIALRDKLLGRDGHDAV